MSLSCLPRQTLSEQQRTRHSSYCLDRSIHRSTGIAGCLQQKISRAVPLCSAQQGYCRSHRRRLSVRSAEAFDRPVYADPRLPTQGEAVVRGPDRQAGLQLEERPADVDYLAVSPGLLLLSQLSFATFPWLGPQCTSGAHYCRGCPYIHRNNEETACGSPLYVLFCFSH